nr:unnamed protein product [Callosobruchus analis]
MYSHVYTNYEMKFTHICRENPIIMRKILLTPNF